MTMNYADMLESIADAFPDDIVVSQGDKRITWRLFDERSARLSQAFNKLGAGKDDMVAFLGPTSDSYRNFMSEAQLIAMEIKDEYSHQIY